MKCQRCAHAELEEREREGITVDVCPNCRGLWLDRGELERFLAFAARELDDPESSRPRAPQPERWDRREEYAAHRPHHHRRKSFFESLGDIFD